MLALGFPRFCRFSHIRLVLSTLLVAWSAMLAPASAQSPASDVRAGAMGTVETVAGPGFCASGARRDESSPEVGAMGVDAAGRVFFDTGPERAGVVAVVESGRATKLVTGLSRPRRSPPSARAGVPAGASRLAPDGRGGVLLAAGRRVIGITPSNAVTTVAGSVETGADADDPVHGGGVPALSARLINARSITTDDAGNLYVADEIDGRVGTVRIRFVNRSSEPVSFYPGTPEALVVAPGDIATIAGAPGTLGGGDGGPARSAVLQGVPPAMAVAGKRLYIASSWTEPGLSAPETARVRLINLAGEAVAAHALSIPPGNIDTVAGGGPLGHLGDGGPARSASFSRLPGIAADTGGNLFVADELNNRVRRMDAVGVVTTVAGRPGTGRQNAGFNGNDRAATDALLNSPVAVAVGSGDRLYVADRLNHQVRVVEGVGTIRAVPGSGIGLTWDCTDGQGDPVAGSPPEAPQRGAPVGVDADAAGNLYAANADGQQVVKVDPSGVVTTIAGRRRGDRSCLRGDTCAAVGDGGPALEAELVRPLAVELTPSGEGLYVFDATRIRFVNLTTKPVTVHGTAIGPGAIQTVAGNGTPGATGDGGQAVEASVGSLEQEGFSRVSLATDRNGNLFVADPANDRVRRVDGAGLISSFAGAGATGPRATCCTDPVGLAFDVAGNLYVADLGRDEISTAHPRVWVVNLGAEPAVLLGQQVDAGSVQVVAGNGSPALGPADEGARAVDAQLQRLTAITVDKAGTLYLSDTGQHQEVDRNSQLVGGEGEVRRVDSSGMLTLVIGNGQSGFNGDGLKAKLTSLNSPADLAVDACGNLIVADRGNDRVRRLNLTPCRAAIQTPGAAPRDGGGVPRPLAAASVILVVGGAAVGLLLLWRSRSTVTYARKDG